MESFWEKVVGDSLRQGDFLLNCPVASFSSIENEITEVSIAEYDLIVLTQSCDLENGKADFVARCPIFSLTAFEEVNPG